MFPFTSSRKAGVEVPIPTLPALRKMLEPFGDQRPTLVWSISAALMVESAILVEVIDPSPRELMVTAPVAILSFVTAPVASMEAVTPWLVTVSATLERKAKAPETSCCRGEISEVKFPSDPATLTPRYRLLLLIFERMLTMVVLFDGPLTLEMACPFPIRTLNSPPEIVTVCCSP